MFVGAPDGEEEKVKERFLEEGILPVQLIVRRAKEREQLVKEFCQADLVIMPSRTEGFGLAALEALSAGLPVLVSGNSGIGKALKKVPYGSHSVVNLEFNGEDSKKWAEAIKAVCRKEREVRLAEAVFLRQNYAEKYQWEGQCCTLVEKMCEMIKGQCCLNLLLNFLFECCFGLSGNLSSSMSVFGDVSDTLVSLSLLLASGEHD